MNREHVKKEPTRQKGGEYGRCDKVVCAVSEWLFQRLRQNVVTGPLTQTRDRAF